MKKIFYLLLLITWSAVISCQRMDDHPPLVEQSQRASQSQVTPEKAKAIFEYNRSNFAQSTRGQSHDDDSTLMPGVISVDWSSSVWSSDGGAEALENKIIASKHFSACNKDVQVEVSQRLLTFVGSGDTLLRQYIATIIPTPEFYNAYRYDFADRFVQCTEEHGHFSGIVLYHTLDGLFCEIARFDSGQIDMIYNAVDDYNIGDYQNMVASVDFVMGDYHLHLNQSAVTRCEGIEGCTGACIEPVAVVVCRRCGKRLPSVWYTCNCKTNSFYDPANNDLTWINSKKRPEYGGGGELIKDDIKRPCFSVSTGQANPLMDMELAPPSSSNPSGATWGYTRENGRKLHQGIDLAARLGTHVYAVRSGHVTRAIGCQPNMVLVGEDWEYPSSYGRDRNKAGNRITITTTNGGGADSYWHLQSGNAIATNPRTGLPFAGGDWVNVGEHIGYTGRSGNGHSEPYHLHFGTQDASNKWIDPVHLFNATLIVYGDGRHIISTPCD